MPALGKQGQDHQKFKVILSYTVPECLRLHETPSKASFCPESYNFKARLLAKIFLNSSAACFQPQLPWYLAYTRPTETLEWIFLVLRFQSHHIVNALLIFLIEFSLWHSHAQKTSKSNIERP